MTNCGHSPKGTPSLRCTEPAGHIGPHLQFPWAWGFEAWQPKGEKGKTGDKTSGEVNPSPSEGA